MQMYCSLKRAAPAVIAEVPLNKVLLWLTLSSDIKIYFGVTKLACTTQTACFNLMSEHNKNMSITMNIFNISIYVLRFIMKNVIKE